MTIHQTPSLSKPISTLLLPLAGVLLLLGGASHAQTCSSFRTCAEAMRSFRSGNTRLDGDKDGIPCEKVCGSSTRGGGGGTAPTSGGSGGGQIYIAPAPTPAPRTSRSKTTTPQASGPVELISVGDGDTIRVRNRGGQPVTIRLACIDAPETAQGESGVAATQALKQLLAGTSLQITPQTVDRYGRTVAEVYANGRNVNLALVQLGKAYVYRQYLAGCDQNAYLGAEALAERRRLGVWRWGGTEQRPWDFRQDRRSRNSNSQ